MQSHGQVLELPITAHSTCRCGVSLPPGTRVSYWRSSYGQAHDQIIACPSCSKPKTLVPERMWLMKQRAILKDARFPFMYGQSYRPGVGFVTPEMPFELEAAMRQVDADLESNWRHLNVVLMKLLDKLPRCEECSRYATYFLKNGPFVCEEHAKTLSTAQKVDWADELKELGVDQ